MRLLGVDPNGFAQRIQDKMIKLLVVNRADRAQDTPASTPTQALPPTPHKVSVRNLPLPQSAHGGVTDLPTADAQLAALRQRQGDPVAMRAIAQFTEGQPRPAATEAPDGMPGTAVSLPDTPAVLSAAQLAVAAPSRQTIGALAGDATGRMKAMALSLFAAHDATIRTAAVLAIACAIALAVAVM